MGSKSINVVFAENLAREMAAKTWTQMQLAKESGIAQTTIGNYLNPGKRGPSKSGKQPSAKLSEMAMIAAAFSMEPWELLIDRKGEAKPKQAPAEGELVALFRELPPQAQSTLMDSLRLLHRATRSEVTERSTSPETEFH